MSEPAIMDLVYKNKIPISVASVNRLPLEVLGTILLLDADDKPSLTYFYRRAGSLKYTCKHWYSVIENTPSFWRRISPQLPLSLIEKIISKGFPLSVSCDTNVFWIDDHKFEIIFTSISRWAAFKVYRGLPEALFTQLEASGGAPLLEIFAVNGDRPDAEGPLDLFGGQAPRLKGLHLGWCSIKWDSGLLHNLKSLALVCIFNFAPTKRELAQVLSQNLELQTLRLRDITFATEAPASIDAVVLPSITILDLHGRTIGELAILLEVVRTPACRSMSVGVEYEDEGRFSDILRNTMPHIVEWGRQYMPEARHASVCMGEEDGVIFRAFSLEPESYQKYGLEVDSQTPWSFELEIDGPSRPGEVLSFVADMLSRAARDMIEISLDCHPTFLDDTENHFLSITSDFPGVTSLELQGSLPMPFDYTLLGPKLARPLTTQDGSRKWLFPQLKKLTYDTGRLNGYEFLAVLRSRCNTLPDDPTPLPARLSEVILRDIIEADAWTKELRKELEETIGEGKLTIEPED